MQKSPNLEARRDDSERKEGLLSYGSSGEEAPLALDLKEEDILRIIGKRVEDGESYWNEKLQLDEVRNKAENYFLGNTFDEQELYPFQIPYKNNRILTAVEVLLPMITSQIPLPDVTEGRDTDESRQLAMDLRDVLTDQYDEQGIRGCFTMAGRHILEGLRVGILKYHFDPDAGERLPDGSRKGAIVWECLRPGKVVFDAGASNPQNIPLIAEYMEDTIEVLTIRFPEKKEKIFNHFGIVRGTKSQLARKVGYMQVWFTYYDAKGQPQEAVAYQLSKQLLLGATRNPNWNYDEFEQQPDGKYRRLNFFDAPQKPYILVNHINLGRYVVDDTSLADQSHPLQDVLEKRGRQIMENADQASSGLVLNSNMISMEDAGKLIGDPSEKIMVAGDVREAAARLPYNMLPQYVINDKIDARGEIDNIYGANAPVRGESSNIGTLGQEVLSQRANAGRLQTFTNSIEDACGKKYGVYPAMVQMMKVFWDEPEIIRYTPTEGKTRFIEWKADKIEDGVRIKVKAGSATPRDKNSIKQETLQIAPSLDPLSLAEGLDKPNPKEFARRIVYYNFFMDKYLMLLGEDDSGVDNQAMADIQVLLSGRTPPIPEAPSQEYLATMEKFLTSQGFKQIQDPNIRQNILAFVKQVNEKAKTGIGENGEVVSEQTPAQETPAEEAGVVPGGNEPAGGQPPVEATPTPAAGQNFLQRLVSKVKGK